MNWDAIGTIGKILGALFVFLLFALMPAVSVADTMNDEIDYLIDSVGRGGCTFIRNDRKYLGRDAREHLRSKRRLNAQLINSTEEFIEKIASESSTSGAPYLISCRGQQQETAIEWFSALLEKLRGSG